MSGIQLYSWLLELRNLLQHQGQLVHNQFAGFYIVDLYNYYKFIPKALMKHWWHCGHARLGMWYKCI